MLSVFDKQITVTIQGEGDLSEQEIYDLEQELKTCWEDTVGDGASIGDFERGAYNLCRERDVEFELYIDDTGNHASL